jgi:hypothetical protein
MAFAFPYRTGQTSERFRIGSIAAGLHGGRLSAEWRVQRPDIEICTLLAVQIDASAFICVRRTTDSTIAWAHQFRPSLRERGQHV